MVGTTILGVLGKGDDLPPEVRSLNRYFRLLEEPNVIRDAFLHALEGGGAPPRVVRKLKECVDNRFASFEGPTYRTNRKQNFEKLLSREINANIVKLFRDLEESDHDDSLVVPVDVAGNETNDDASSLGSPQRRNGKGPPRTVAVDDRSTALISNDGQSTVASNPSDGPPTMTLNAFWTMLLEGMHLELVSRTNRVWGRAKIYEVYRLNGVASTTKSIQEIRDGIQKEFNAVFRGGEECRTYALKQQDNGHIYIHLVIGKPYDYYDERNRSITGEKKKKKANEFCVVVKPGSSVMAVTASRAPSKSRFVHYALTAFDLALSVSNLARDADYRAPVRVGDLAGTVPMDLLEAATLGQSNRDRYVALAAHDKAIQDPLVEMRQVALGSVVDRTKERARLATSAEHGREAGQIAAEFAQGGAAAAAAMTTDNGAVVIHHGAAEQESRKRKVSILFGNDFLTEPNRLKFQHRGTTDFSTAAYGLEAEPGGVNLEVTCSLRGDNAYEGMKELWLCGAMKGRLPDYLKDASKLMTSTITVVNGAAVTHELEGHTAWSV